MKIELSKRLQLVRSYIADQSNVADIGADHAYLLLSLAEQGKLGKGVVGELNDGPLENARRQIERSGLSAQIDVRKGDGLAVLKPQEVDTIVLAGMGGTLIARILERGREKLVGVKRLVLQPNVGGNQVRVWADQNGWHLVAESLVEDAGILYEVIVLEPGEKPEQYIDEQFTKEELLAIGPLLWQQKHPLLVKKCKSERESCQRIIKQLAKGKSAQALQKTEEIRRQMNTWERVIQCLSVDGI